MYVYVLTFVWRVGWRPAWRLWLFCAFSDCHSPLTWCSITPMYTCHDSFICAMIVCHDSLCAMTHCVPWLIVCHDSFIIRVPWLIHMLQRPHSWCSMSHSYVWHDSLLCAMTYLHVTWRYVDDSVMSHIWISHVMHINESCHTYEWVMSRHATSQWVMSHDALR